MFSDPKFELFLLQFFGSSTKKAAKDIDVALEKGFKKAKLEFSSSKVDRILNMFASTRFDVLNFENHLKAFPNKKLNYLIKSGGTNVHHEVVRLISVLT